MLVSIEPRLAHKESRVYSFSSCGVCGSHNNTSQPTCPVIVCLACGSPLCLSYSSNGKRCPICLGGILPGQSEWQNPCDYRDCGNQAVFVNHGRRCCLQHIKTAPRSRPLHGRQLTVQEWIEHRLQIRDRSWHRVATIET